MEGLKIVALSIVAAVAYGIAHDQITIRICPEYFTVYHARVFNTDSLTLLAIGWGIIATWWVGALLGVPLAMMARVGAMPKLSARELVRPLAILMLCCALAALIAGVSGFVFEVVRSGGETGENNARFMADLWAHNASYLSGFLGGFVLMYWTWRRRYQAMQAACRKI